MNNWYNRVTGGMNEVGTQQMQGQQNPYPQMMNSGKTFQNPIQKANYIMQAMRNPAQFIKQQFPDVPDNIANDPNQILQYIQRTRNISNEQLSQIMNSFPRW